MIKIAMIRHGKTYGNTLGRYIGVTDEPLCEEGKKELEQRTMDTVELLFVSPLKRCLETADILYPYAKQVKIPEFAECNFGEFENKNYQELKSSPEVWLITPPMIQSDGSTEMEERAKRVEEVKDAVETIGEKNKLTVLDLYSYSQEHPEWYQKDGIRLNKDGAKAVADMVGDCSVNKKK